MTTTETYFIFLFCLTITYANNCSNSSSPKILICTIIRDWPSLDLQEWIQHHIYIGVNHFYLLEHKSKTIKPILNDYIEKGIVTYNYSDEDRSTLPQLRLYNDCLNRFRKQYDFIAYIDSDEYIIMQQKNRCLNKFMEQYTDFGALGINWLQFGSSGHQKRPPGGTLGNYVNCNLNVNTIFNRHVKVLINTKYAQSSVNPHHFVYSDGKSAMNEHLQPIHSHATNNASWDIVAIHHYQVKSKEDFKKRKQRGHPSKNPVINAFDHVDKQCISFCWKGVQAAFQCCSNLYSEQR